MEQFQNYFVDVLKSKYFLFSGRAPRREYWYFVLFSIIVSILLGIIDGVVGTMLTLGVDPQGMPIQTGILGLFFSLFMLLPATGIAVRRLHDIGKSGWWYFIVLIPFIGILVLLYFLVTPSQEGENQFGPYPVN